jgi:hypothetical protein
MSGTTVRDVLFETADEGKASLAALIEGQNDGAAAAARKTMPSKEIAELLWDSLDLPLGGLVFGAWERHELVEQARQRTKANAATTERVRLAGHTVRSEHEPRFEIEVGGVSLPVLELQLAASLVLDAAVISVSGGRLNGVSPGACSAQASLSCAGQKLCERSVKQVTLPDVIRPPAEAVA